MKKIMWAACFLFSSQLLAEGNATDKLKQFIAQAKYIHADFTQIALDESGKAMHTSQGIFYLQQPGKFRWNYIQPYRQDIVSKQGKIWFYDADLEQVIIKKVDKSIGDTPALLLSGSVNIEEKFTISEQGQSEGLEWVKLTPKSEESSFKYIMIGLKDDLLYQMELSDNFGQLTQISFSNLSLPKTLEQTLFDFIAPEGTDVFEE